MLTGKVASCLSNLRLNQRVACPQRLMFGVKHDQEVDGACLGANARLARRIFRVDHGAVELIELVSAVGESCERALSSSSAVATVCSYVANACNARTSIAAMRDRTLPKPSSGHIQLAPCDSCSRKKLLKIRSQHSTAIR